LLNAQILLIAIGGIVWEAVHRFTEPAATDGRIIIWIAAAGVLVNTFTALLFLSGHRDLNVRGAFLHMAADAGVSLGVVLAGVAIAMTGRHWIDPVTSLIVAMVILASAWGLLRESLDLALHAVPRHVDMQGVKQLLSELPGVTEVHDLHVWAMSTTETALTAHLVKPQVADDDELLAIAARELRSRFTIEHITLQVERTAAAQACKQAPDDVV
jgi:cobalt-zinc-cadmium efflux system protein